MEHQISLFLYGPKNSIENARMFLDAKMECVEMIETDNPENYLIVELMPRGDRCTNVNFESIVDPLCDLRGAGLLTDQIDRAVSIMFSRGNGGITIGRKEIRKCSDLGLYIVVNE